jgi:hypothetical protein
VLELIVLIMLCRSIGKKVRAKGRAPLGYQMLLLAMWFGGEVGGGILGAMVSVVTRNEESAFLMAYGIAVIAAIAGVTITFVIVNNLSSLRKPLYDASEIRQSLPKHHDMEPDVQDWEGSPATRPSQQEEIYRKDQHFHS